MVMSYEKRFYGEKALGKQTMRAHGELVCLYTGVVFSKAIVDAYNRYTADFNRSTWRAEQEFLLDQRHKFIHELMYENLAQQEQAAHIAETPIV